MSDFVDLLNREMEELQKWCQGKEKPKTAVESEEFFKPFVYQIEKLMFDNYKKDQRIAELEEQLTKWQTEYARAYVNRQNDLIAENVELKEQLKNSRVKYFIGFDSDFNVAVKELDLNIVLPNWMYDKDFKFYDTKSEAIAKLKELKGE